MKPPFTSVKLMTRDGGTLVMDVMLPETFEPYDVVIWQGRFFVPHRDANTYNEAVSFHVINGA